MAESRFNRLAGKLAKRKGVTNPRALAAYIGREKYGAKKMGEMSAASRERHHEDRTRALKRRKRH